MTRRLAARTGLLGVIAGTAVVAGCGSAAPGTAGAGPAAANASAAATAVTGGPLRAQPPTSGSGPAPASARRGPHPSRRPGAASTARPSRPASTAPAASAPKPPPGITGTWTGSYTCPQGPTGLRLVISPAGGKALSAVFHFYPLKSGPSVPSGSFTMTGSFRAGALYLTQNHWIKQPPGYTMVDLTGKLAVGRLTGKVLSNTGCTTWEARK